MTTPPTPGFKLFCMDIATPLHFGRLNGRTAALRVALSDDHGFHFAMGFDRCKRLLRMDKVTVPA